MLDKKTAYEVLGLKYGAGKGDIERRFTILLKKERAESQQSQGASSGIDMEKVTAAYNLLMGYTAEEPTAASVKPNPILKKLGVDEKKMNNFFYYYKFHILIGVVIAAILFFAVRDITTKPVPDIKIAFLGGFYMEDSDELKNRIEEKLPAIKEASIDQDFAEPGADPKALSTKGVVLVAAGEIDLYILNKDIFDRLAGEGAFESLDGLAAGIGVNKEDNKDYVIKSSEDDTAHLYGIDVSKSSIFTGLKIVGEPKIAAIGLGGKFRENAEKLLNYMAQN